MLTESIFSEYSFMRCLLFIFLTIAVHVEKESNVVMETQFKLIFEFGERIFD